MRQGMSSSLGWKALEVSMDMTVKCVRPYLLSSFPPSLGNNWICSELWLIKKLPGKTLW
jgi:hypothetical protein